MKNVLIFGFIIFVLFSINASAHSPSSMSINYDNETKILVVSITHIVSNPEEHYIYNITIEKNNNFYKSFDYTSQPSSSSFTYNYSDIDSINGDMFSVTARCIQGGQISKSLTVGSSTGDTTTPGFEIIFVILAIVLVLFWKTKKIK
jgi:hypothetical protein